MALTAVTQLSATSSASADLADPRTASISPRKRSFIHTGSSDSYVGDPDNGVPTDVARLLWLSFSLQVTETFWNLRPVGSAFIA